MLRTSRLLAACPALLLAACGPSSTIGGDSSEIVGGFPISIEDAPWQISLQEPSFGHFCGGSILSRDVVLTAQHCTAAGFSNLLVVAGIDRLSASSGQAVRVADVIPFPGFTGDPTQGRDVSLLRLAEPLELDGRRAAAIPIADAGSVDLGLTDPGVRAIVSGWGTLTEDGSLPDNLQAVEVPIVSNEAAQAAYAEVTITDDQLAAGDLDRGGVDSCQGDSGGPLVVPDASGTGFLLAGVVSWGEGCARPDAPGMYARVSSFVAFIADNVGGAPPLPPPPAGGGLLLINEVLADPGPGSDFNGDGVASSAQDEFVELLNIGDGSLDMSGATVADGVGVRGSFPDGTALAPGEVLVVFGGGTPTGFDIPTFAFPLGLNNGGDRVTIRAADGTTVLAEMAYGPEGGQDQSLVREVEGQETQFVLHGERSSRPASPGTRADGSRF